VTARYQEQYSW